MQTSMQNLSINRYTEVFDFSLCYLFFKINFWISVRVGNALIPPLFIVVKAPLALENESNSVPCSSMKALRFVIPTFSEQRLVLISRCRLLFHFVRCVNFIFTWIRLIKTFCSVPNGMVHHVCIHFVR